MFLPNPHFPVKNVPQKSMTISLEKGLFKNSTIVTLIDPLLSYSCKHVLLHI